MQNLVALQKGQKTSLHKKQKNEEEIQSQKKK